jgi:predicted ATPase
MRVYSIQPSHMREAQEPDSGEGLRPDGSNAASVLQAIRRHSRDNWERIGQLLEAMVPHLKEVRPVKHGNKLTLKFTQEWGQGKRLECDALNASDGALHALGLLVAVYQRPRPSLLVIKEPETAIYHDALPVIPVVIQFASNYVQVLVTTHSPDLLDAEWLQDRHLRIVEWQEGATHVRPLWSGTREAMREHLYPTSELLRSNALRGMPCDQSSQQLTLFEDVAA